VCFTAWPVFFTVFHCFLLGPASIRDRILGGAAGLTAVVAAGTSFCTLLLRETPKAVPKLDGHVDWLVAENWVKGSHKNAID
jgi:hypothetical protein